MLRLGRSYPGDLVSSDDVAPCLGTALIRNGGPSSRSLQVCEPQRQEGAAAKPGEEADNFRGVRLNKIEHGGDSKTGEQAFSGAAG